MTELPTGRQKTRTNWQQHFEAAATFAGTDKEYCEKHGLHPKTFSIYKRKFGFATSSRKKSKPTSFSKIKLSENQKVQSSTAKAAIDPKWLASFLKELWSER